MPFKQYSSNLRYIKRVSGWCWGWGNLWSNPLTSTQSASIPCCCNGHMLSVPDGKEDVILLWKLRSQTEGYFTLEQVGTAGFLSGRASISSGKSFLSSKVLKHMFGERPQNFAQPGKRGFSLRIFKTRLTTDHLGHQISFSVISVEKLLERLPLNVFANMSVPWWFEIFTCELGLCMF